MSWSNRMSLEILSQLTCDVEPSLKSCSHLACMMRAATHLCCVVLPLCRCLSAVDNRTGSCHAFGVTGGAIRVGDYKLVVSHVGRAPWEDSSPAGTSQYTPGGRFPNGTSVFTPATPTSQNEPYGNVYDAALQRNITVYVFNIKNDPIEANNLAGTDKSKLKELLDFYNAYVAANGTVMGLSWRYGFQDSKHAGTVPPNPDGQHCTGAFNANGGSPYCHFGREFECFVRGRKPATGSPIASAGSRVAATALCQSACAATEKCEWWVLRNVSGSEQTQQRGSDAQAAVCDLYGASPDGAVDCSTCEMGPKVCPGMHPAEQRKHIIGLSQATVDALVQS
eukprot:m.500594 g.500594  ORF g.500594 m.500594 type:complete len:337 (+) comp21835_c0_seq1:188-1198(+)